MQEAEGGFRMTSSNVFIWGLTRVLSYFRRDKHGF
jgi:hypothetical protein